ncbi:type IV secretory system conjugative DNA transfer family protein [Patescibacteria group bacterium]|nr:type IV secretory system conjugative DNA transfer family protein [Patescibacteria group bacterium]MCG2702046.1 type IV secretory system conjugative DNA transfer family protein [Candidatus Parcubacteria bacterium]MBU4265565.1 type IV secretory system conjugative DNA transfer family protein [Patescibacteria group bacterium]MBU4389894.1 type IV secretory system conjugative DNA transfer family protein [Patescibacteria group bacterium]MBU4431643.1 type IV secretory system conjugative DNA transfer
MSPPATDSKLSILEILIPKNNEFTPESMSSLLANFTHQSKQSLFQTIFNKKPTIASLEIALINQQIRFFITSPTSNLEFLQSQIIAQFPSAIIKETETDYLSSTKLLNQSQLTQLTLSKSHFYTLKTNRDFHDTDPLNSVLAPLSRSNDPDFFFLYQIILSPAPKNWQNSITSTIQNGILVDKEKNFRQTHPDKRIFEEKIQYPGILTQINLLSNNPGLLASISSSFGIFTNPQGNFITSKNPGFLNKNKLKPSIINRQILRGLQNQILNTEELSAIWHFPNKLTKLPNIAWGKKLYADPPDNLPVATQLNEEQKSQVIFFAKTEFRNQETIFGIKQGEDRRRHTYIIGKSGTGKTTLIANMAIDDIRKGRGVAIIDPHGDLCENILNYIPSHRINDCCYFNPADPDYVYPLNILEAQNDSQRELVASSVISIFKKLYSHSWGPRLEHILRNTLLTLVNTPNSDLTHVIEILTNSKFRHQVVEKLTNQTLKNFWINEYDRMEQRFQNEAISPILNKVGQFISSTNIRNTIAHSQSKVNIQQIMDEKKILIADLSTGKLGEDNSALLGAMLITQIQLSAMNRIFQKKEEREDFYLYVDEFQNFATEAFIKILSEARKFHLNLIVANQYMAQLDREIQDAILGNVGSIMSFIVGSQDAFVLQKEFGPNFPAEDLIQLGRYQVICKLSIDSETKDPFYAVTLPPPSCKNQQKDKLIHISQERWGKKK